jgi:hypothetical protein
LEDSQSAAILLENPDDVTASEGASAAAKQSPTLSKVGLLPPYGRRNDKCAFFQQYRWVLAVLVPRV